MLNFWLGLDLITAGLGLQAKNYGLSLGLVDVALASCTYGLVNILRGSSSPFRTFEIARVRPIY